MIKDLIDNLKKKIQKKDYSNFTTEEKVDFLFNKALEDKKKENIYTIFSFTKNIIVWSLLIYFVFFFIPSIPGKIHNIFTDNRATIEQEAWSFLWSVVSDFMSWWGKDREKQEEKIIIEDYIDSKSLCTPENIYKLNKNYNDFDYVEKMWVDWEDCKWEYINWFTDHWGVTDLSLDTLERWYSEHK